MAVGRDPAGLPPLWHQLAINGSKTDLFRETVVVPGMSVAILRKGPEYTKSLIRLENSGNISL